MERYWVYSQFLTKEPDPTKGTWNTEVVKYADAQATIATLTAERDSAIALRDRWQAKLDKEEGEHFQHTLELVDLRIAHEKLQADLTALRTAVACLLACLDDVTYTDDKGRRYASYREDVELDELDKVMARVRSATPPPAAGDNE